MSNVVAWDEVQPIAAKAFRIWVDQPELRWAEAAWAHLTKAGLTADVDQFDRLRTYIRLLVLASMYRDWCAIVWDEVHEDEPQSWLSDDVEVSQIQIGQMLGPDEPFDAEDGLDEALNILMEREREAVVDAVLAGFGSDADLFLALWRGNQRPNEEPSDDHEGEGDDGNDDDDDDDDDRHQPETDAEILNDIDESKLAGYQWIREGCPFGGPIRCRSEMD